MDYNNRIGPHSQRHPRPAMKWLLVAARRVVSRIASAKKLLSSVLLSVSVKENVQETDYAEHNSQVAKYKKLIMLNVIAK